MVTIRKINKKYGGNICRRCINETYKIHLNHSDCLYGDPYPAQCPRCKDMRNIVSGFQFSGFIKLLTR